MGFKAFKTIFEDGALVHDNYHLYGRLVGVFAEQGITDPPKVSFEDGDCMEVEERIESAGKGVELAIKIALPFPADLLRKDSAGFVYVTVDVGALHFLSTDSALGFTCTGICGPSAEVDALEVYLDKFFTEAQVVKLIRRHLAQ